MHNAGNCLTGLHPDTTWKIQQVIWGVSSAGKSLINPVDLKNPEYSHFHLWATWEYFLANHAVAAKLEICPLSLTVSCNGLKGSVFIITGQLCLYLLSQTDSYIAGTSVRDSYLAQGNKPHSTSWHIYCQLSFQWFTASLLLPNHLLSPSVHASHSAPQRSLGPINHRQCLDPSRFPFTLQPPAPFHLDISRGLNAQQTLIHLLLFSMAVKFPIFQLKSLLFEVLDGSQWKFTQTFVFPSGWLPMNTVSGLLTATLHVHSLSFPSTCNAYDQDEQ